MILLIGISLLFILLIVFMVMCAKQTHWLNLVGAFFVFLFAVFYLVMAGMVFETNRNWKEVKKKNQEKLDRQSQNVQVALTGNPTDFEWPHDSLKGLETEAAKQVLGQGRVWRECIPGAFAEGTDPEDLTGGSLTVTLPPNSPSFAAKPDPAAVAAADAADGTSLVYAFLEVPDGAGGYMISRYIGSFFATDPAPDNTTVKLSPSLVLPNPSNTVKLKEADASFQTAREIVKAGGGDGSVRWALYDILPIDSYDVFSESIRAEQGDPELEVTPAMLRDKLTQDYMPLDALRLQTSDHEIAVHLKVDVTKEDYMDQLMAIPQETRDQAAAELINAKYNRIINSIVYTGETEKVCKDAGLEPNNDEKWYRVDFKRAFKNESFKVDFDTDDDAQGQIALQGQAFDRDGLALLEMLKLGEKVKFDKDESVLLDHSSWIDNPADFIADMKNAGDAVAGAVIYRRKLNDFDYDFRALVEANEQLTSDRDHAATNLAQLQVIEKAYEAQQKTRTESLNRLNKDVTNFKQDKTAVEQYRQELEVQLDADRKEIDKYFRLTKELSAKKAELEEKLAKLIDENTKKAEAAAGNGQ